MQQMVLQRAAQQQRRDSSHLNGTSSGLSGNDPLMGQNPATATANALAAKMYEERLKLPTQRDSLDEASMKLQQRYGENVGQALDPNHVLLKAVASGHSSGQILHGSAGGLSGALQVQARSPQLPMQEQSTKTEINPVLTPRTSGPEGSFIGVQGSNQGGSNLTLKGWPLTGLDQLRPGILQQKSFMQSPQQQFQQLQFLNPQQQHLFMQAQQNMVSPTTSDVDTRRLRMLLNSRNMVLGQEGQTNSGGDIIPNIGSPSQSGGSRTDIDMLIKKKIAHLQQIQQQGHSQQQHQLQQPTVSSQQSQSSNQLLQQQEKPGVGCMPIDEVIPNSFVVADQTSKKRKKPVSSSGRANSSGTANTAGPSPSSAPSTPSTHTDRKSVV